MSESEHPNPNPKPEDLAPTPGDGELHSDPPLVSGSSVEPERDESAPEASEFQQARKLEFGPGEVIAAEPISMMHPEEVAAEVTPRSAKRRNLEEMGKRPSWLPEGWNMDLKVRSSGASAGLIDRYYIDPSGRKFRSMNEVLRSLETGNNQKRKPTSEVDDVPFGNPVSSKEKKSSAKRKKSGGSNSDSPNPAHVPNGVEADTTQEA